MRATLLLLLTFGSTSAAQENSAVFGVVRDAQTQQPIKGATVYLQPYILRLPDPLFPTLQLVTDSFIGFQTTTNLDGSYRFEDLPPHRYCLFAHKDGYWWATEAACGRVIRTIAGRDLETNFGVDRAPILKGDSSTIQPAPRSAATASSCSNASGHRTYGVRCGG